MNQRTKEPSAVEATLSHSIERLQRSEKGRATLRALQSWLVEGDGCSLDGYGKQCAQNLIDAAFGSYAGTALDLLRNATR